MPACTVYLVQHNGCILDSIYIFALLIEKEASIFCMQ